MFYVFIFSDHCVFIGHIIYICNCLPSRLTSKVVCYAIVSDRSPQLLVAVPPAVYCNNKLMQTSKIRTSQPAPFSDGMIAHPAIISINSGSCVLGYSVDCGLSVCSVEQYKRLQQKTTMCCTADQPASAEIKQRAPVRGLHIPNTFRVYKTALRSAEMLKAKTRRIIPTYQNWFTGSVLLV